MTPGMRVDDREINIREIKTLTAMRRTGRVHEIQAKMIL